MSTRSNNHGRAYEYAWMTVLCSVLRRYRNVRIVENSSVTANRRSWDALDAETHNLFATSAAAAVDTILMLEPKLTENVPEELTFAFQQDQTGIRGDVRDIVLRCASDGWEIGLSLKHNHEAVKHCRLSRVLDFGKEWFGVPCGADYWNDIRRIFDDLMEKRRQGWKWSDIPDKGRSVYLPLLTAFIGEVRRAYCRENRILRRMMEYLIGTSDYYKVISHDTRRLTMIRTFNLHGTLGKPSGSRVSVMTIPVVELPSELIALRVRPGSENTAEMYMNNGWQVSFRIHSASTCVEPSLKFDVQFVGMPPSVLCIECRWRDGM